VSHDYQFADLLDEEALLEIIIAALPLVVVRASPLGVEKQAESRQTVRPSTEKLQRGSG
jgi:hypothetical protein